MSSYVNMIRSTDVTKHHSDFSKETWYLPCTTVKLLTLQLAANMKSFPGEWREIQFSWHKCLIQDQSFEYLLSSPRLLVSPILTPLQRKRPQTSLQPAVIGNPGVLTAFLTGQERYGLRSRPRVEQMEPPPIALTSDRTSLFMRHTVFPKTTAVPQVFPHQHRKQRLNSWNQPEMRNNIWICAKTFCRRLKICVNMGLQTRNLMF